MNERVKRTPDRLPRRMHAILFIAPHPMAGQVVRIRRNAAICFNHDEAAIVQFDLEETGKVPRGQTEIVTVVVKEWLKMLAPARAKQLKDERDRADD